MFWAISSFLLLQKKIVWKSWLGRFFLGVSFLLAFTFFFFTDQAFRITNSILVVVFGVAAFVVFCKRFVGAWWELGFLRQVFIIGTLSRNLSAFFIKLKNLIGARKIKNTHLRKKILTGLVIAVPLLIIVVSLLANADAVFNELVSDVPYRIFSFLE